MNATVKDVMTTAVVVVRRGATFKEMAAALRRYRVSALPVVDADGKVIGVISRTDLLAVYDRPDSEIRDEIEGLILHEFLEDPRQFAVSVQDGVVTVQGNPETAALGHHIVGKLRHVQGVVAVRDQLSYPDVYPIVAGPVL